jgi:hypothetical protein
MEPEVLLQYSQDRATDHCLDPNESNTQSQNNFNIIIPPTSISSDLGFSFSFPTRTAYAFLNPWDHIS